jgi:hypothetical protein
MIAEKSQSLNYNDFNIILVQHNEFLTEETTCTNEMAKETTSENICQKRPLLSGGTPGQATRGTCRLGQCRQGLAAVPSSGMLTLQRRRSTPSAAVGPAANGESDMLTWRPAAKAIAGTLPPRPALIPMITALTLRRG